jgi:hypothetical protein
MHYFAFVGCLITLALGLLGALAPTKAALFVSIEPKGRTGVSEMRATFGGLYLGLAFAALALQTKSAFIVAAACWLGAALLRAASVVLDDSRSVRNLRAIGVEAGIGALFVLGTL